MAGVNKNFVVKNGLEVNNDLIFANATNDRVGINTNDMKYALHVNGGIGVTNLYASGIGTFNSIHLAGSVTAGTAGAGSTGQYLVRVGSGVSWQNLPSTRSSQTFTATAGQTVFSFSYTVGQLDVFINGVKLSPSEYTANDTASVILNTACFGDETVELISYSSVNPGYGFTGIYGISLFEEGSPVGTTGQVVTLNFVGAAVTATASGVGATIYFNDSVNANYWGQTAAGIHTTSNVGVGTTNPRFALEVGAVGASGTSLWVNGNARVTGILTVGSSSIVLDGSNNTINVGSGITINGNTGIVSASNFYANGLQVGVLTATTIVYQGGTTLTQDWTKTAAGIHTLSNVGIGTTNPTSALTVSGTLNVSGIATFGSTSGNAGVIDVRDNSSGRTYITTGAITFNNTGSIQQIDTQQYFRAGFSGASSYYFSNYYGGFDHELFFISKNGDIRVAGNASVSGVSTFSNNVRVTGIVTANSVLISNDGGKNGSVLIEDTGAYSQITFRSSTGTDQTTIQGVEGNLYITPGSGGFIGLSQSTYNLFYDNGNVVLNNGANGTTTLGNGVQITGLTSTTSLRVGTGGTVINATAEGLVGIGTTNATHILTVGSVGAATTNLVVNGYARINGLLIKADSESYLQDSVIISTNPAAKYTGYGNVAIGANSFTTPGAAQRNVAIGLNAFNVLGNGNLISTYDGNTALGAYAGENCTTTLRNTLIGFSAGRNITTGQENVILGSYNGNSIDLDIRTSSNNVVLSDGAGNIRFYANSSGNVGFGTTNPTSALTVKGNTSLDTLSVSGVSTFVGLTTFKNYVTITELGSSSYDGIRFISGSNFAIVSSDSLGNLIINSQSTNNRTVEINGYSQFYANSGNVQLNNGNSGTTKVGSAITFTSNTGEIFTTGNARVGVSTAAGVILTSPNGTKYQLFVEDDGTLKTVAV